MTYKNTTQLSGIFYRDDSTDVIAAFLCKP